MDLSQINYLAVFVAGISGFAIGAVWYSPLLFSKIWARECGLSEEKLKSANMFQIFGTTFILLMIQSFNLAAFLGTEQDIVWGMTAGALAGIGWVVTSIGILFLFERRSFKLFLIDAGYLSVVFIVMGAILGAWK